jgi:hypothetical protein
MLQIITVTSETVYDVRLALSMAQAGHTSADQELLLMFTESRGPPHIVIFLVVYRKIQEIYNNNDILILVI